MTACSSIQRQIDDEFSGKSFYFLMLYIRKTMTHQHYAFLKQNNETSNSDVNFLSDVVIKELVVTMTYLTYIGI